MFQCSTSLLLCNRVSKNFTISLNCNFFTFEAHLSRFKKLYLKNNRIKGPLDDKSDEFDELSTYNEDGEQDFGDFDFSKAHLAFDEYHREEKRRKHKIEKAIIVKKFFSPGKQPSMLTYNEKECIKYLNRKDPVQWDVQTLSESFPATPDIIIKILRSHWKPSPEKIKEMDLKVQENWELFNTGKLEATPELIAHLKKFSNRKQISLEHIKNSNFYFPEIKKEKIWNNGEMNQILTYYEKAVTEIHKKNANTLLIENENEIKLPLTKNSESDKNEVLFKHCHGEQSELNLKKQESITLKQMFSKFKELETTDNLKNNAIRKNEVNSNISETVKKNYESSSDTESIQSANLSDQNQGLSNLKKKDFKQFKQKLIAENTSVSVTNTSVENDFLSTEEITVKLLKQNEFQNSQQHITANTNLDELPNNTKIFTQANVSDVFDKKSEKKISFKKNESRTKFKNFIEKSKESVEKDKIIFEKEENDLKHTAFWNDKSSSEEKKLLEESKSLNELKDVEKVTKADVYSNDCFSSKIKVPKILKGSGLVFKIKDCYYDDDGKFLYRVPGMTK